jgi:arylsulfatase A-like enzyme
MIVKWPGVTAEGSRTKSKVIIEDFFSTILDIANVTPDVPQTVDGESFVSILSGGESNSGRPLFWHYPNKWGGAGPGIGPSSTIRKGDWKLIYFHKSRTFELYNLAEDIGELDNLTDSHADRTMALAVELGKYLKSVDAQMPYDKSQEEQVPYPDELF